MALSPPKTFDQAIPLMLLCAVLGLPAVLILITTRKVVYVVWMLIYLLALPVWNFILPVYAFWHFDDFSWGETRKVQGETKGEGHGSSKKGAISGPAVPMRRWEDWERSRLRKLRREDRRRRDLERIHPGGFMGDNDMLSIRGDNRSLHDGSDTYSIMSSDDDHWATQIGGYNERDVKYPPPPIGLVAAQPDSHAEVVDAADMEAMLNEGFDDAPSSPSSAHPAFAPRYQTSDSTAQLLDGYNSPSAPGSPRVRQPPRQPRDYGPLGPLDPSGGRF